MKKWSITFAALLVVLLASCNPINSTPSVKGEGILETKTLNISVSASSDDLIAFPKTSANARTIIGDSFVLNGTDAEKLYFYLYGNSQDGTVLDPKEISVSSDDGITGKVLIDIECLNWELTLVAATTSRLTETDAILDDAVLIGYANVDMQFTNNIKFTLTPDGLTKPGNVNLSVKLDDWTPPTGYEATAKIVNMKDGSTVKTTDSSDLVEVENIVFGVDGNFNFNSIAPGIYTFLVDFVKDGERRTYNYSDTIIILPGRTITKDVIIPKKIQDKPTAPTDFTVEYVADSEDIRAGFYEAQFTWTDNSNNESNFALEILEINENDDLSDPWGNANNTVYVFDYDNDIRANSVFYKEGSLFANNTSITVYLGLGKRYMARLYAQNDAGLSDADDTIDGDQSPDLSITGYDTASYLNRYKITYNLQGGTLTKDGNPYNVKYVEYYSQPDEPNIITPNGEDSNPTLQIGSGENAVNWTYWEKDSEKYEETSYTGFKNLDLYAVYAREGDVEIYDPNNYEILDSYIASFTGVSNTETQTYSKNAGTAVQIELDNEVDWNYDTVSLKIEYSGRIYYYSDQDGTDSNTFDIDLTKLPSGRVYNFVLTATYGTTIVTYPMSINITD